MAHLMDHQRYKDLLNQLKRDRDHEPAMAGAIHDLTRKNSKGIRKPSNIAWGVFMILGKFPTLVATRAISRQAA